MLAEDKLSVHGDMVLIRSGCATWGRWRYGATFSLF